MQINPILRLSFLGAIAIISFFSIILVVNGLSGLNKQSNDVKAEIYKQQIQSVNYRSETERKIDEQIRDDASLGEVQRININNTIKAAAVNVPGDKVEQAKPAQTNTQKSIVAN